MRKTLMGLVLATALLATPTAAYGGTPLPGCESSPQFVTASLDRGVSTPLARDCGHHKVESPEVGRTVLAVDGEGPYRPVGILLAVSIVLLGGAVMTIGRGKGPRE